MMFTLILAAGMLFGILGITQEIMPLWAAIVLMVGTYIVYLVGSFCTSKVLPFVSKVKPIGNFKAVYLANQAGKVQWHFHITCYHTTSVYDPQLDDWYE